MHLKPGISLTKLAKQKAKIKKICIDDIQSKALQSRKTGRPQHRDTITNLQHIL